MFMHLKSQTITLLCLSSGLPIVIALASGISTGSITNLQELGSRNSLLISIVAYSDVLSQSRET